MNDNEPMVLRPAPATIEYCGVVYEVKDVTIVRRDYVDINGDHGSELTFEVCGFHGIHPIRELEERMRRRRSNMTSSNVVAALDESRGPWPTQ